MKKRKDIPERERAETENPEMSEDSGKLEEGYQRRLGLVVMGFVLPSGKLCWSLGSKASRREERGAEFFCQGYKSGIRGWTGTKRDLVLRNYLLSSTFSSSWG